MQTSSKILIIIALVAIVAGAVVLKQIQRPSAAQVAAVPAAPSTVKLPKLLDLGAGKCIPCKAMAPILEDLKKEYAGQLHVEFIDVWQNPDAAKQYGVEIIPLQIFYNADGKELFRHTGFFSKEDILGKWKEFGVNLGTPK
jgi:thioredoxin 1